MGRVLEGILSLIMLCSCYPAFQMPPGSESKGMHGNRYFKHAVLSLARDWE